MTTLISFIGRPKQANSQYTKVTYRFEDGFTTETTFFGYAALQHLLKSSTAAGTQALQAQWIVIGTPTSGWDLLADVAIASDAGCLDRACVWAGKVRGELANGTVAPTTLQAFEHSFTIADGVTLSLHIVDDDADAIFRCLHDSLPEGGSVVLDVTHALRSMPIHALIALGALSWIKNITIADIEYGAFDRPPFDDGATQAVSLRRSAHLARATPSLAAVHLNADLEAASQAANILGIGSPTSRKHLADAHVLRSIMHGDLADRKLRDKAVSSDDCWSGEGAIATLAAGFLRKRSEPGPQSQRPQREFLRAHAFLQQRDYMRAVFLLAESITLYTVHRFNLDRYKSTMHVAFRQLATDCEGPLTRNTLKQIRLVRNSIAHGKKPDKSVERLIDNPTELRTFLEGAIRQTRDALFPKVSLD